MASNFLRKLFLSVPIILCPFIAAHAQDQSSSVWATDLGSRYNQCYGEEKLDVAAIINWYGIADVNDLIKGSNLKNNAVMWLGSQSNAEEIAHRVSPLTYVRSGLPPILSIHGDKDDVVPYSQSVRLHEALVKAKVPNQLLTIKDGGHGGFQQADYVRSYETIWTFLRQNKIIQ